jgi:hypothetical protein
MAEREDGPNPPSVIGTPHRPPSREELMSIRANAGSLESYLIEIGWYYNHPAPGDRDRGGGRER